MLEYLNALDRSVFLFMNVTLANPVTDFFMPVVTSDNLLRVLYGFLMALILWRGDARLRWLQGMWMRVISRPVVLVRYETSFG